MEESLQEIQDKMEVLRDLRRELKQKERVIQAEYNELTNLYYKLILESISKDVESNNS